MNNVLMIMIICELAAVFALEWARISSLDEINVKLSNIKDTLWDENKHVSLIEAWDRMTCDKTGEINKHIDAIYKEIYKNKSGLSDITIKDAAGNEYKFEQSMED